MRCLLAWDRCFSCLRLEPCHAHALNPMHIPLAGKQSWSITAAAVNVSTRKSMPVLQCVCHPASNSAAQLHAMGEGQAGKGLTGPLRRRQSCQQDTTTATREGRSRAAPLAHQLNEPPLPPPATNPRTDCAQPRPTDLMWLAVSSLLCGTCHAVTPCVRHNQLQSK